MRKEHEDYFGSKLTPSEIFFCAVLSLKRKLADLL